MLININELKARFNINIKGILHIGAHNCEELNDYISSGVNLSNIYWVEALPKLVEKNKRINPLLNIYQAVIYDEDNKEIEFNITNCDGDVNNLQSSSILEFGSHKTSHPQVKVVEKVKMKTSRMDSIIEKYGINMKNVNFINLDIQGVELRALKSMESYLNNIDYIYTEVNTEEVYKNCDQMTNLSEYLFENNFRIADARIYKQFGWGDAFYIKNTI
jgi:FkbM family methyltransferase